MGSQTHPIQHVEFGVNTNSSNHNFSTQTEPIELSNQTTNTSYFNEMTAQTQPAKEEDCKCESPLQPFQSDFARQLHEGEVMRRNPQTRMQREIAVRQPIEYIQQKAISHAPQQHVPQQAISLTSQQALQYTRPPVIEHNQQTSQQARTQYPHHTPQQDLKHALSPTRQTHRIENMEIDYQSPALQNTQKQKLEYKPHEDLQHTQNPALEYSTQALEYSTQKPALEYSTHQPPLALQQPHLALHQPH